MAEPFTYVPVLRWKPAEQAAFASLSPDARRTTCPLIEICPPGFPKTSSPEIRTSGMLRALASDIIDTCRGHQVFIDLIHLERFRPKLKCTGGLHPLLYLFQRIENEQLLFPDQIPRCIPVTGIRRSREYISAATTIAGQSHRLCVRLTRQDSQESSSAEKLLSILDNSKLEAQDVDIVIDLEVLPRTEKILRFLEANLPLVNQWRTITFVTGTFPVDLQKFNRVGRHDHARAEWHYFVEHVLQDSAFAQVALYGDYTVQHPIYREPPPNCNPSASIRYATSDSVIVMKGEALKKKDGPGAKQWPAQAKVLSSFKGEFLGPEHCAGCDYIASMASGRAGTGDCTSWLTAAIGHAMSVSVEQVNRQLESRKRQPARRSKSE